MKNVGEWWGLVLQHREVLKGLVLRFYPGVLPYSVQDEFPITVPGAERACQVVRKQIIRNPERPMPEQFDQLLELRDKRISSLLNSTWFGMPESYNVRFLEGFGVLCTLCEENYLLYEDEIPD